MDMASLHMPDNNRSVLEHCQFIYSSNDTYRSAAERVISHFLTEVDILNRGKEVVGDDEKEKWKDYLNNQIGLIRIIQTLLRDRQCYGNSFCSIVRPFRRILICPGCYVNIPLKNVGENPKYKFSFDNGNFCASCPSCGHTGGWDYRDDESKDEESLRIKRWDPLQIEILNDPISDDCRYIWKIPEEYKKRIRAGELFLLERCPRSVLEAIRKDQFYMFDKDAIFHMKEPTLAGIRNNGWGISRVLTSFRQIWYVQVLHRYNEAIALDYVIPFRLITPMPKGGTTGTSTDPLLGANMGDFSSQVRRMLRQRRRDPATWHTLPFPVQYQALGGDATQLAPKDLLDQGIDTLLNGAGVPVEMYRGSMTMQAAPVGLRLFEAMWQHLVHDINDFLRWLTNQISRIMSWELVSAKLRPPTLVDDINQHMAVLQLMMGNTVSQTTGLRMLGIDFKHEQRQIAEEARYQSQTQAELQEEMEQSAFGQQIAKGQTGGMPGGMAPPGGGMPPGGQPQGGDPNAQGGMPPGPVSQMFANMGPNTPVTPEDTMANAESIAQQLLGMPESQKDSELRVLKQKNPVMHSVVSAKLKDIRSQAQTAGGSQLMAQQFGGQ
jgi:hypothetical protein